MQTKIKNPYAKENCNKEGRIYFSERENCFNEGVQAALAATKPRSITEEPPAIGQHIILIHKDKTNIAMAIDKSYHPEHCLYWMQRYTHWLPYPELL